MFYDARGHLEMLRAHSEFTYEFPRKELRNSMEISSIFWRPKTVVSTVELLSVSMVFYSFKIHQNVFCLSV